MANAEHLALLQQGTAIWNDWRIRNPGSLPDLRQANLKIAYPEEAAHVEHQLTLTRRHRNLLTETLLKGRENTERSSRNTWA
jgi:hypothetical protein